MEATNYIFLLTLGWLATGMDAFRPVNGPLRPAIKTDGGIRRPLMRNDRLEGIYLKPDQRSLSLSPFQTRQTHYVPRPRILPQQQQQHQGFLRNANLRHPHRPAPVPIHNHLGALAGGRNRNPGRARLPQSIQHHHSQLAKIPINIKHPHNQQTTDQQQPYNQQMPETHHQDELITYRPPEKFLAFIPATTSTVTPITKRTEVSTVHAEKKPLLLDPKYLLNLDTADNEYLTYLYLAPGDNRLEEEYLRAAANTGDMMRPLDDHEIIIGSPSTKFDPYQSRGQVIRALPPYQERIAIKDEDVIKLLEDDWVPIPSPWDKYRYKLDKASKIKCNQGSGNKC